MDIREIIFYAHITSVVLAAGGVLFADKLAFSWLQGKTVTLDARLLKYTHLAVSIALLCIIGSGFLMFWPAREYLLHSVPFYIKMSFVGALIINSFAIGHLMPLATQKRFSELSSKEKTLLFVSGGISTMSWIGAGVTAFFLF